MQYGIDVRNIIDMLQPFVNKKRLWNLLEKWFKQGFYDYWLSLDLGWFEIEKFQTDIATYYLFIALIGIITRSANAKKTTNLLLIIGLALGVKKNGLKVR